MRICTRAPGITPRATHRPQLCALPAPSSRPPQPPVPAEGRRRHAAGPTVHTRARECRALVGSGGRRGHQTSSTCVGRSRRATAWRSGPATPPAPGGEPPGRRTPSAARPPAFPPRSRPAHSSSSSRPPDQPLQRAAQRDAGAMFLDKPADCRQRPPDGKLRPSDPRLGLLRRPQRPRAEGGQDAPHADTEWPSAPGLTGGGSRAFGPALVCGLGVWRLSAGRCAGSCDGRKRRYGRALAML